MELCKCTEPAIFNVAANFDYILNVRDKFIDFLIHVPLAENEKCQMSLAQNLDHAKEFVACVFPASPTKVLYPTRAQQGNMSSPS